jgi:uncharacterized membrane protein
MRRDRWIPYAVAAAYLAVGAWRVWPAAAVVRDGLPTYAYYLWSYRHGAYSDIVALYVVRDLYLHRLPYVAAPLEYPPVIGMVLWATAWMPGLGGYLVANILLLAAGVFATVALAEAVRGPAASRAWAFSPLLAVYAVYNWDVLGLVTWGLAAWAAARRRYGWAGWWVGVGVATKLFPVVLLPYWLAERAAARDGRGAAALVGGAAAAALGLNAPFAWANYANWSQFWRYNSSRGPDPGLWQWLWLRTGLSVPTIDALSLAVVAAGGLVLAAAVWRRRLEPLQAAALALGWWFLWNKVYSPQYMVWVLYALVLAGPPGTVLRVLLNAAGLLDFGLAMAWLATGTAGSPLETLIGTVIAPWVILLRDGAFLGTFLTAGRNRVPVPASSGRR